MEQHASIRSAHLRCKPKVVAPERRPFFRSAALLYEIGFWRMSGHPAVQQALRNHYFDSLGLPRIYVSAQAEPGRTAVVRDPYARWCWRGGTARCPPIPIKAPYATSECRRPIKMSRLRFGRPGLPPHGSAHHHVDLATTALRAYQPIAPVKHRRLGAVVTRTALDARSRPGDPHPHPG